MSLRDELAAVIAQHDRGDWSDRTFSCRGCAERAASAWESSAPWRRREHQLKYKAASHPGWNLSDYHAHLAEAIQAVTEPAIREAKAGALREYAHTWGGNDVQSAVTGGYVRMEILRRADEIESKGSDA